MNYRFPIRTIWANECPASRPVGSYPLRSRRPLYHLSTTFRKPAEGGRCFTLTSRVGKEQVAELLVLSESEDAEDRLVAAENLCSCHVRTRIPAVWEALFRMMEDVDPRVRQAAWHTIEDGGKPTDDADMERLEAIYRCETHPKLRKFAELTLKKVLGPRRDRDLATLWAAGRPEIKQCGKCDFCGETDVFVSLETSTLIPTGNDYRAALICERCGKTA